MLGACSLGQIPANWHKFPQNSRKVRQIPAKFPQNSRKFLAQFWKNCVCRFWPQFSRNRLKQLVPQSFESKLEEILWKIRYVLFSCLVGQNVPQTGPPREFEPKLSRCILCTCRVQGLDWKLKSVCHVHSTKSFNGVLAWASH